MPNPSLGTSLPKYALMGVSLCGRAARRCPEGRAALGVRFLNGSVQLLGALGKVGAAVFVFA